MARVSVEVADIFRSDGAAWRKANAGHLSLGQLKAMTAIEACRTAELGGHVAACEDCGHTVIAYNSCGNRHCPKCQGAAARQWLAEREAELLPLPYYHVVFTLPSAIGAIAWQNKAEVYGLLFKAASEAMLTIAADQKHLGARIGITAVLHTWGSALTHHPHVHMIVPGGGLSLDGERFVPCRRRFFLPVRVLSRVFRGKFLAGLKRLHRRKKLQCAGPAGALADQQQFAKLLRHLHRHDWVVYAKPAFGGPLQVLRYLGRYTHRVAISNHRLLAFDQERVTFRWKDYARGGKQGTMTLVATEFLRRFFLHVLPKGFVRIRHFGLLANRFRASRLALGRQRLASSDSTEQEVRTQHLRSEGSSLWHCPRCGASMIVVQRLTAADLSVCTYFDSS